jgi:translation initiation factor 2 subunit 1
LRCSTKIVSEAPVLVQKEGFPQEGELVLCEITSVYPTSAFARLEEYKNLEGMIHIAEVSSSWVKNIRSIVKEGKKVVCLIMAVDREKRHIALSLKRVSEVDKRQKFEQVKRGKKTSKMMELVAAKVALPANLRERLEKEFTEVYFAFEAAARSGAAALIEKGIEPQIAEAIETVGKANISFQDVELKANVILLSYDGEGVESVKRVLSIAEKKGAKINYISAPKYRISVTASDYKLAERKLRELAEELAKRAKAEGAKFDFTLVKEGNKEEEVKT